MFSDVTGPHQCRSAHSDAAKVPVGIKGNEKLTFGWVRPPGDSGRPGSMQAQLDVYGSAFALSALDLKVGADDVSAAGHVAKAAVAFG